MLEGIVKKIPAQRGRDDRKCRGRDDNVMKNVTGFFAPCGRSE